MKNLTKCIKVLTLTVSLYLFFSCSNDVSEEVSQSKKGELNVMNFVSTKIMHDKIDEIIAFNERKQNQADLEFINYKLSDKEKKGLNENEILVFALKKYHSNILKNIYQLRKEINFVSIKSIADEINSLKLINPEKAINLQKKYKLYLTEFQDLTTTIFDDRLSNIINLNGEVLVNGSKVVLNKNEKNIYGKYVRDELVNSGIAATSGDWTVYYSAGRELHENDLGFEFYKYYTSMHSIVKIIISPILPPVIAPVPVYYQVNPGSKAGFAQSGYMPVSPYFFEYDFISGFGASVRNTGGNKNTKYKPVGGNLSATFTLGTGSQLRFMSCDLVYNEI